jgi:hypothetical protein
VTAYNATTSSGDTTNFQQQQRVLSRLHRENNQRVPPQPRHQFILDFQGWLETRIAEGQELIAGMDTNDSYNPDSSGTPHSLEYTPDLPTVSSSHNGKLETALPAEALRTPWHYNTPPVPFQLPILEDQNVLTFF